jgi:hypothetical protein
MKHGDILHFKAKGIARLFAGFNRMRTGLLLEIEDYSVAVIFENKQLKLIPFKHFELNNDYISSRPEWVENPTIEVMKRLNMKYKNEHVLFAEIIGVADFDKVKQNGILEICIEKRWLQ